MVQKYFSLKCFAGGGVKSLSRDLVIWLLDRLKLTLDLPAFPSALAGKFLFGFVIIPKICLTEVCLSWEKHVFLFSDIYSGPPWMGPNQPVHLSSLQQPQWRNENKLLRG